MSKESKASKSWCCESTWIVLALSTMIWFTDIPVVRATPPTPPARLILPENLAVPEAKLAKAIVPINIQINQPVRNITVTATLQHLVSKRPDFEQPKASTIYTKRFAHSRELKRGLEIPIRMEKPGEAILDIRLVGQTGFENGFSDRILLYVIMKPDKQLILMTPKEYQRRRDAQKERSYNDEVKKDPRKHPIRLLFDDTTKLPSAEKLNTGSYRVPENRRMLVRPSQPSKFLLKNSVDARDRSWNSQDPITVRGRLWYQDVVDNSWKPLVNASVYLWDDDTFGDDYLGSVATGWDGRWSFTVNNDDGLWQDGRDIYYTFSLDNTRFNVGSCSIFSGPYQWKSAVHNDLADGTVLDFGDETATTHMDALSVFSTINLAWNHASTVGGWDPGMVEVCFPGSGTYYDGKVNVASADDDGPDSITHEYGHAIMAHAYTNGDPSPGGSHGFGDCNQNKALSWSEGWATGFMLSVRPDGRYNWHEGDGGQAIENFSSTCNPKVGEKNEGWVAASLLDMYDSSNDTNGGNTDFGRSGYSDHNNGSTIRLATMLRDTMVGSSHHNDMIAYWSSLSGEVDITRRSLGQEIMYYDYMSVLPPNSCVATKVATQNVKKPEALLSGLRQFRDLALKNWVGGRDLINMYYRNSPEIALLLLRNHKLVPDALKVMRYFSHLGYTFGSNTQFSAAMENNYEVIPDDIARTIERVVAGIYDGASNDLKKDLNQVRENVKALHGVSLFEYRQRIIKEKEAATIKTLPGIQQGIFTETSREALKDHQLRTIMQLGLPRAPSH